MSAPTAYPNYSPGLQGIIAGITTISEIDVETSSLTYRGINVHELAEHSVFEETAFLLLMGHLPNKSELADFKATIARESVLPKEVTDALKLCPKDMHPMDKLKVGFALLAPFDSDYKSEPTDHAANVRKAVRIQAKAGNLVAAAYRTGEGLDPIQPDPNLGIAGNFMYQLKGERPDEFVTKVMDASLTLYAEHGFNASTFACRVCVATLSDLYSGVCTGIGTLKGPLHGGANEEAMYMLMEIDKMGDAAKWTHDALAQKKKIMGFGHREYRIGDSRAAYMSKLGKEIGVRVGDTHWGDIAETMEKIMWDEKKLFPNVDFPSAYAYYLLGIPIPLYTPIFVIARVSGWCAHMIEQLDNNRLIRPTCIYEGPKVTEFVALENRR